MTLKNQVQSLFGVVAAWGRRTLRLLRPQPSPRPDAWFSDAEVAGYDDVLPKDDTQRVDDATWRDLDVQALLNRIASSGSIYARQYLYLCLRRGAAFDRGVRPRWMGEEGDAPRLLEDADEARRALRQQDVEVTALLHHGQVVTMPGWLRHLRWVKTLWIAGGLLACAGWVGLGAACVAAWLVAWAAVEIRFHARLQLWKRQRAAIVAMLKAIVDLGALARRRPHPVLADLAAAGKEARRLLIELQLDAVERAAVTADYINLLTLHEYAAAPARRGRLEADLPRLQALYAALAECDGRLCLIEWLQPEGRCCWARPVGDRQLSLVDLRHPLLPEASPLTIELHGEGIFLSGENGIGKSTLLRAIGLNVLLARAFGFCHASKAAVPPLPVWSSMVHEESIETGESLYMAEMSRASTLLRVAEQQRSGIFLVDEIFRGTNHVESVAAATAVLNRIAAAGLLVASSHHVVLAPLLRARLAPWRVARNDHRGLVLEPGALREPNGLAMMEQHGLAADVRKEARRVHDWFASHVATPITFPPLA